MTCDSLTVGKILETTLRKNWFTISEVKLLFSQNTTITTFSQCVGKWSCDRLRYKLYLNIRSNIVEQTLIIVPGVPSSVADWLGLRGFVALELSNWEMRGNSKNHCTIYQSYSHYKKTGNLLQKLQLPVPV